MKNNKTLLLNSETQQIDHDFFHTNFGVCIFICMDVQGLCHNKRPNKKSRPVREKQTDYDLLLYLHNFIVNSELTIRKVVLCSTNLHFNSVIFYSILHLITVTYRKLRKINQFEEHCFIN